MEKEGTKNIKKWICPRNMSSILTRLHCLQFYFLIFVFYNFGWFKIFGLPWNSIGAHISGLFFVNIRRQFIRWGWNLNSFLCIIHFNSSFENFLQTVWHAHTHTHTQGMRFVCVVSTQRLMNWCARKVFTWFANNLFRYFVN